MTNSEAKQVIESIHSGTSSIMLDETNETLQNSLLRDCEALEIAENLFDRNEQLENEVERVSNINNNLVKKNDKLKADLKAMTKLADDYNKSYTDELIENKMLMEEMEECNSKNAEINNLKAEIEQLKAELEQSVKLPCKIGDTVYATSWSNTRIFEHKVTGFKISENVTHLETYDSYSLNTENLDKHLFLTREEAEQSLRGGAE